MNYQRILVRSGFALGLALTFLVALALVLWWLAFSGNHQAMPAEVALPVAEPTALSWFPDGAVRLDGGTEDDTWALLGYAHGMQRAWVMALLRQAAMGHLGTWFGADLLVYDAHLVPLIRPDAVEDAYAALPAVARDRLVRFAEGVNVALVSDNVQLEEPFVLLGQPVLPWEPWHTLLLERLYAWLSADLEPLPGAPDEVHRFGAVDRSVREWLGLHGMANSLAWAVDEPGVQQMGLRLVYGTMGHAFSLHVMHPDSTVRLYVPGLPRPWAVFSARQGDAGESWIELMESRARVASWSSVPEVPVPGAPTILRRQWRIEAANTESVVEAAYQDDMLLLGYDPRRPAVAVPAEDTLRAPVTSLGIAWAGFRVMTDAQYWATGVERNATDSGLWEGAGLTRQEPGGTISLRGTPRVVERAGGRWVVGRSVWTKQVAEALVTMDAEAFQNPLQNVGILSPWAQRTAGQWLSGLSPGFTDQREQESFTYLRNWRGNFEAESIGATLFDTWVAQLVRDSLAALVRPAQLPMTPEWDREWDWDSAIPSATLRTEALSRAVASLANRYGPDVGRWQWGSVSLNTFRYPVWNDTMVTLHRANTPPHRRYAPIQMQAVGHASALLWAPSSIATPTAAPAATEVFFGGTLPSYRVREPRLAPHRFLSRYREEGSSLALKEPYAPGQPAAQTRVYPEQ